MGKHSKAKIVLAGVIGALWCTGISIVVGKLGAKKEFQVTLNEIIQQSEPVLDTVRDEAGRITRIDTIGHVFTRDDILKLQQ